MRRSRRFRVLVAALAGLAAVCSTRAGDEKVPLYTNDDLDRMFGPPPPPAAAASLVDKATPEDWRWVEQFIDRQYARIDADRRNDLDQRAVAIAQVAPVYETYPVAWRLGYPASVWYDNVRRSYLPPHSSMPFERGWMGPHGSTAGHGTHAEDRDHPRGRK